MCYNLAGFIFWLFGPEARGLLMPGSGMEPTRPVVEGKVWAAEIPGTIPPSVCH